jgi:predicted GNAT family acetyltransferase
MRVLGDRDVPAVLDLLDRDPIANLFVASRVRAGGLDPGRLGAEVWGHEVRGRLSAACYAGANLVPVNADDDSALGAFAARARKQGRRCSSIVGPARMVERLWHDLLPAWGPARDVRLNQPLLAISNPPDTEPDTAVRRVRLDELDILLPASIAMFTEEVGVSPIVGDGGALYRSRVRELVAAGRSFARIDDGRIIFKAEVGAATNRVCQVQGVWVDPDLRGRGLSGAGMAAVVAACQRDIAPTVSLYVNDFNEPARRAYKRVGFDEVGTLASVLF